MKSGKILFALAALLLTGCFKEVTYKTNYVVRPLVQTASGNESTPLTDAVAHAFHVDTALYTVASYADAVAGVVTLKSDRTQKISTPAVSSEPYTQEGTTGWIHMQLNKTSQLVVVADQTDRLYAVTQQKLGFNLKNLYVELTFKPWKEGTLYTDGRWLIYNEFYTAPTYLTCYVSPSAQTAENGETAAIASLKTYIFVADTTAWRIASYDDAVAGQITSKSDNSFTRTNALLGYKESSSELYKIEKISGTPIMVVVVDREHRRYAYSKQAVDLTGSSPTFSIVFRLWNTHYVYEENGWVVVNPALAPTTTSSNTGK